MAKLLLTYIFILLFTFTTTVNGTTSISLKHLGNDKEQITRATIGDGEIIVGGVSNPELDGLNRDTTKAQEITKDITTGTLDATASIDNRVFTSEGRAEIAREHEGLGENLSQIGNGLRNNIITKTIENTRTGDKSLSENFYDYVEQDRQMTELKENRKDLMLALNGMTNFDSEEAKNILQQIADLTAGENGFSGKLQLANVDGNIIGFAYQSNDGEVKNITLNMANIDMSDPKALMNVIYHETTNFEEHSANEVTAKNRGDTGAGIFGLKNYGNENTNVMSGEKWLEANGGDDTIRGGNEQLVSDIYRNNTNQGDGNAQLDDIAWGILDTIDYVGGMLLLDKDEETGQYVSLITKEPFTKTEMAIVLGMDFVSVIFNIIPGVGKASTTAVKKTTKNVVKNGVKTVVKGGKEKKTRNNPKLKKKDLDDILKGATKSEKQDSPKKNLNYEKNGGEKQRQKDFDSLNVGKIEYKDNGVIVGTDKYGNKIDMHKGSKGHGPTLEIIDKNTGFKTKIRYK